MTKSVVDRLIKALAAQLNTGETVVFTPETLDHLHGMNPGQPVEFLDMIRALASDDQHVEKLLHRMSDEIAAEVGLSAPSSAAHQWLGTFISILAEQVGASRTAALVPDAVAALTGLSRAEACEFFAEAGSFVHYDRDQRVLDLIRNVARSQPREARLGPGDRVKLTPDLVPGPHLFDPDWHFFVVFVGDDGTVDVQPELVMECTIQRFPTSALTRA